MVEKQKLLLALPDTKIILTRDDDISTSLLDRLEPITPQESDTNEIAIYISIHTDWNADKDVRGYRFLVNDSHPKFDENYQLAAMLSLEFSKAYKEHKIPNRGIQNMRFLPLHNPNISAIAKGIPVYIDSLYTKVTIVHL